MFDLSFNISEQYSTDYLAINNCDKDGTVVAKRLASCYYKTAPTRHIDINVNRETDELYFHDMAAKSVDYYSQVFHSKLIDYDRVIVASVHPAALYLAEVLHCPLLPAQFISFAKSWSKAMNVSTTSIAGADYDSPFIWQWNKFDSMDSFPSSYLQMIKEASEIIVLRSNDYNIDAPFIGKFNNLYVHCSIKRLNSHQNFWKEIEYNLSPLDISKFIGDWEWGLPDSTICAIKLIWKNLGKSNDRFHIIEGTSVYLYEIIPKIWQAYLELNDIRINGFTLNSYFVSHPYYERMAGLIPFHFYNFQTMQPFIVKYIKKHIMDLSFQQNFLLAFVNDSGSINNVKETIDFIKSLGLSDYFWFSVGFDCLGADDKNIWGEKILSPFEKVKSLMN